MDAPNLGQSARDQILASALLEDVPLVLAIYARLQPPDYLQGYERIMIKPFPGLLLVHFIDRRIIDEAVIQGLGFELQFLVYTHPEYRVILSLNNVEFLSSAALGKLILCDRGLKALGSHLTLASIPPEIYEVFTITKLDKLFNIKDSEVAALAAS